MKMFNCVVLCLSLLFCVQLRAQHNVVRPDSTITYSFLGKDTSFKTPISKHIYYYLPNYDVTHIETYKWDFIAKQWNKKSERNFQRIANDIIETEFIITTKNENKLNTKTVYTFNSKKQLIKVNKQLATSLKGDLILTETTTYNYEKDSLVSIVKQEQGTSFFISYKAGVQKKGNKVLISVKEFGEHDSSPIKNYQTCHTYAKDNTISSFSTLYNYPKLDAQRNGFVFSKTGELKSDSLIYTNAKTKKDSCAQIKQFTYSSNGYLLQKKCIKTNAKGQPNLTSNNELTLYFCNPKIPMVTKKPELVYFDDFVYSD